MYTVEIKQNRRKSIKYQFAYVSGKTQNSSSRDVTEGETTPDGGGKGPHQNGRDFDFTRRNCQL